MNIREVHTALSAYDIYLLFKDRAYPIFLDSGMDPNRLGQFSFIVFDPIEILKTKNNRIEQTDDHQTMVYEGNPFDALNELYMKYQRPYEATLPFMGGLVGFLGYDLCHHIEALKRTVVDDTGFPDLFMGVYPCAIVYDHMNSKCYVTDAQIMPEGAELVEVIVKTIESVEGSQRLSVHWHSDKPIFLSNFEKKDYLEALTKLKNYIRSGDIYQANMTQRFETILRDRPLELYQKLRDINPAPFAAYLPLDEGAIISSSPERFIKVVGGTIETRPIKGTRPRGRDEDEDLHNKNELIHSEKDQSELLMIIDLERNDLSRIAKVGTVKVPELMVCEAYPTVFHLVSTVTAEVRDGLTPIDVIKATFPGGSITGAPKIRAMEIIDELEPTQRGIYTGSIGYIGFNGDMDLNIAIRSVLCTNGKAYFQAGGGIVWDSVEEDEYEESLTKARAMREALSR